ncbi:hypothetical protein Salbus254_5898 [Streptomyces albidoflavus]|nr:hypothetical protein Salbus254_5898 [Streptomyces albidoflavus]
MTAIAPHPNSPRWRDRPIVTLPLPGDAPVVAAVRPPDDPTGGTGPRVACRDRGRVLRRPRPSGLGPVCERKQRPPRATIPAPRSDDELPGQTALELRDYQPTLDSL